MSNSVREALEGAARRHWQVRVTVEWIEPPPEDDPDYNPATADEDWGISGYVRASRGDLNCPHDVTYHPGDGHGYEQWPEKTNSMKRCWYSWEQLVEKLKALPDVVDRPLIRRDG